jgi:hypothetical protein
VLAARGASNSPLRHSCGIHSLQIAGFTVVVLAADIASNIEIIEVILGGHRIHARIRDGRYKEALELKWFKVNSGPSGRFDRKQMICA